MADNKMLSKGEGHTGGFAEAQPDSRRFPQTSELTRGSRYPGSSSRLMELNINTISDPIEADTKTSVLAQRPPLRHEVSKDQDVIDENCESDEFCITHFKSPLEDHRLNARRRAKEAMIFTSLVEDRLVFLEEQFQRFQQLTGEDPIVPRSFKDCFTPSASSHAAEIKRMTWAEWKSTPAVVSAKGLKAKPSTTQKSIPREGVF